MKSLITGVDGFIGQWLSKYLLNKGDIVIGISKKRKDNSLDGIVRYYGNILNFDEIRSIINKSKPDRIFHLAAQSNIPHSFAHPQETIEVNVNGTLNLLEAVKREQKKAIFLSVGSSSEYGRSVQNNSRLVEDSPLLPTSPYAVSKVAQGQLCSIYREAYNLKIVHVRPFAIIGPGKKGDAVSDFARGIVDIETGKSKYLLVGNVAHARDFLDVRDAVAAMDLLTRKITKDSIYNLCRGIEIKLENILENMINMAKSKIIIKRDLNKARPSDDPIIVGNPKRLNSLGFKPQYSIDKTLLDTLEYWRNNS